MIIAVVGSEILEERPPIMELIKGIFLKEMPEVFVSGGADGIDKISERLFERMFPYKKRIIIEPEVRSWSHPKGFRWRNKRVGHVCNKLYCVRSELSKYYGSGWTANFTERLGKPVIRYLVTADYTIHLVANYSRRGHLKKIRTASISDLLE